MTHRSPKYSINLWF